ncbi:unnamed protein product [Brugia timori]|uniref:Bm1032 n=2 Tax=Brugia TaxID=6278 RepID=A0A0I9N982_BRUMA|nr:Bm1032 [Brugia malayi]VDO30547.1 unnamed protein product [Brugia timori]
MRTVQTFRSILKAEKEEGTISGNQERGGTLDQSNHQLLYLR